MTAKYTIGTKNKNKKSKTWVTPAGWGDDHRSLEEQGACHQPRGSRQGEDAGDRDLRQSEAGATQEDQAGIIFVVMRNVGILRLPRIQKVKKCSALLPVDLKNRRHDIYVPGIYLRGQDA